MFVVVSSASSFVQDRSVVKCAIEPSKFSHSLRNECFDLIVVRYIGLYKDRLRSGGFDFLFCCFATLCIPSSNHNAGTGAGKQQGRSSTDPGATPSYEDHPSVHRVPHKISYAL